MSRPYAVRPVGMSQGSPEVRARAIRSALYLTPLSRNDHGSARSTHTHGADHVIRCTVLFISRSRMPITPPVKAVLRKDLLLGGAAGTALCAAVVGAAITIGPLLGIDWHGGTNPAPATAEAANLPALPRVSNPSAEALRAQIRAPRIVSRSAQPTTRDAAQPSAAPAPASRPDNAPSIVGRRPQTTTAPPVTPRTGSTGSTGAPDAPVVAAPEPTGPVLPPAAAAAPRLPASPVFATPAAKKVTLRVASVAVEPDDNGSPQLRLSLALERAAGAAAPVPAAR